MCESFKKKKNVELSRDLNQRYHELKKGIINNKIEESFQQAISLYQTYQNEPSISIICTFLAELFDDLNKNEDAEFFYRKAVELSPDKISFYIKLSNFYRKRNLFNSSLLVLNTAKELFPSNLLLHNEFSETYYGINKLRDSLEEAFYCYNKSSDPDYLLKIGIIYKTIESQYYVNLKKNYCFVLRFPLFFTKCYYVLKEPEIDLHDDTNFSYPDKKFLSDYIKKLYNYEKLVKNKYSTYYPTDSINYFNRYLKEGGNKNELKGLIE